MMYTDVEFYGDMLEEIDELWEEGFSEEDAEAWWEVQTDGIPEVDLDWWEG